jgi:hypothetical protein
MSTRVPSSNQVNTFESIPNPLMTSYPLDFISNETTYIAVLVSTTTASEESRVASWVFNLRPPGPDTPTSIAHLAVRTYSISKYKYRSVYQSCF